MVKNLPAMQEPQVQPRVRKIPCRREWLHIPVFLPGEFHGQRSLAEHSPCGHKALGMAEQLTHTQTRTHTVYRAPETASGSSSPASGSDPALSPVGHSIFACIPPKMRHSLPVQLDHFLVRSLPPGISFLQHLLCPKRVPKEPIAPLSPWQPF